MRIVVMFLALLAGQPAAAQTLEAAVTAWLANDDATALPALAARANDADSAAMLLLAMIERRAPSDFVRNLAPADYKALFRKPGGKFGMTWLRAMADTPRADLAAALAPTLTADEATRAVTALIANDEPGLARQAAMTLSNIDPGALPRLAAGTALPADFRMLLWISAAWAATLPAPDPAVPAVLAEATAAPDGLAKRIFLSLSDPVSLGIALPPRQVTLNRLLRTGEAMAPGDTPAPELAAEMEPILMAAPELAPLRRLCEDACAGEEPACLRALYSLGSGYFGVITLVSPAETVIARDRYEKSPRYLADLRLLAAQSPRDRVAPAAGASCAMALLD